MNAFKTTRAGSWLLCGLLMTASGAYAVRDNGEGPERTGKMEARMKKIERQLGLTPDQEKQLEENRKSHREETKKLFEEMKDKREALRNELEKPDFSVERVKAIHGELKEIQNKVADQRLDRILQVRQILTPEQFKRLHELTEKEWEKGGRKHGWGGHRGEGHHEE